MLDNIAKACSNGKADYDNLLYGAYVLFDPIIYGHIMKEDERKYARFGKWASKEIQEILCANNGGSVAGRAELSNRAKDSTPKVTEKKKRVSKEKSSTAKQIASSGAKKENSNGYAKVIQALQVRVEDNDNSFSDDVKVKFNESEV